MTARTSGPTLAEGKPSPHEEILINVEAIRGAIRKGDWKLVRMATFPGKTELYNLAERPGREDNVADQHPEIVSELNARLVAYAREMKPSEWIKAQPPSLEPRARRSSTPTSTSTTAGCRTRSPPCRRTHRGDEEHSGFAVLGRITDRCRIGYERQEAHI